MRYIRKIIKLILKSKKIVFIIKALNLLIGPTSKSNVWQYFTCVIKGNLIDFEIAKNRLLITVSKLLIGFPTNKYPAKNQNYLRPEVFIIGRVSIRGKGLLLKSEYPGDFPT